MKVIIFLLLMPVFGLTQTITIEAENYTQAMGTQKIPCGEGAVTNKAMQFNAQDWVEYNSTVGSSGIYKISVRVAGTSSNIFVCDTSFNVLGKIAVQRSIMDFVTDQTYSTYTGMVYIKAGDKLRIQFRQHRADYRNLAATLDWLKIESTNLLVYNNFDPDWEVFRTASLPWKSSFSDSVNSTYESSPGFYGWIKQTARPESFVIRSNATGQGYAVFTLKKSDTSIAPNVRAEIYKGYAQYQTMWYSFKFCSPTITFGDGLPHTFVQWHGEGALSPCLSIRVENERYICKVLWSAVSEPTVHQGENVYDLGPHTPRVWSQWVIKAKWAYDNTGEIRIWKDGVEVLTRLNAPNCYNDGNYPYLKLGIYKWGWKGGQNVNGTWVLWAASSPYNELVHYYDDVRIGGPNSSYAEVIL